MEIAKRTVWFEPLSGSGPRTQNTTVVFPRNVISATAAVAGYSAGFRHPSDRPFGQFEINTETTTDANTVGVTITFGLRDWSGDWDDQYTAAIEIIVLAELEDVGAGPTRGDLHISGIEFNQAIQFFQSSDHLDLGSARPDNSIALIDGKPTGVRVYVDYSASPDLPAIADLSGELEVRTANETVHLSPVGSISPQRASAINRGEAGHTLNFLIDGSLCRGTVTVRCRVFDATDSTQTSASVSRTHTFVESDPLRIFVVGVNYTGQGLNLPAPTLSDFLDISGLTESVFPIDGLTTTGYTAITFSTDMESTKGNAPGFIQLNQIIRDMKGDSEDIYYGLLPSGVNTGYYSGWASSEVASGVPSELILAHELGHRLGRRHTPCDYPPRCDEPAGVDDDYPRYGTYVSDSIGEFGYDPLDNSVKSPAAARDFMGYSNVRSWVSPHTYRGLMERTAPTAGGWSSPDGDGGIWKPARTEVLFLALSIDRLGKVARIPSFHYPATTHDFRGKPSAFSVEFLDDCHRVLGCHHLHEETGCGCCECWPRHYSDRLPLPAGAHWLVVWEGRDKLYEECIPSPPAVSVDCRFDPTTGSFRLDWGATGKGVADCDVWFLVQWQDRDDTWRGLMPRTRETTAFVPVHLLGQRQRMRVRVLATSGIATGSAECILVPPSRPTPQAPNLVLRGEGGGSEPPVPVPARRSGVRAFIVDELGRTLPDRGLIWFDQRGDEIGRGPRLPLSSARSAEAIRVAAIDHGSRAGPITGNWMLERQSRSRVTFRRSDEADRPQDPPPPPPPRRQRYPRRRKGS